MIDFWLKLWQLVRPYKGRFFLAVLFGICSGFGDTVVLLTVTFVATAIFSQPDNPVWENAIAQIHHFSPALASLFENAQRAVSSGAASNKLALALLVSLVPLVMLARGVFNYLNNYLMGWVAARAICDLRARLFEHLLNLPLGFLSKQSTGELMSRVGDVGALQGMLGVSLVTLVKEPVNIISLLAAAFAINAKLTLIALVVFPFCGIPIGIYNRKVRKAGAAMQSEAASLSKAMHEAFTGNRIVKGYNLEGVVMERFRQNQRRYISQCMKALRSTETPGPLLEFLGSICIAVLLLYFAGSNNPAMFGAFIGTILLVYRPAKAVIRVQSQMHQAKAATERVFELLATQTTLPDPPNPAPLKAGGANIRFDKVNFGYEHKVVLNNFDLEVKPGQMVALVGSSGAGKTTVTNLLLRFYDPVQGSVRIGGTDVRSVAVKDLRSQISVVTQEVILFNDTIRQNIAYGRADATFEEIQEAARHAFAHDFILGKPHGYDSVVGEKGTNLSGGERQRIAIARAILKNAPILVLDEATSSLDNESERMVQAALDELMKARTTICIAHRLSTIQHADLIVVMEHGRIVESGRHAELLGRNGLYQKLHALGFRSNGED